MDDEVSTAGAGHASPYSTGGGGVTLERAYAGSLLASVLTGDPVVGLGDEQTPVQVRFQQHAMAAVDDLVVVGEPASGSGTGGRMLLVGVRRNPIITGKNAAFIKLMTDYVRVVEEHGAELDADAWRLGLAVSAPHQAAREVGTLADLARDHPDNGSFRAAVHVPAGTRAGIRSRLDHLDTAIAAAAVAAGLPAADSAVRQVLTWRLLRALRVIELRLEGDDAPDRTAVVLQLRQLAGDAAAADALRRHLEELAAGYAIHAAPVDEEVLRRDLRGVATLAASPAYPRAWDLLDQLEDRLRARTHRSLQAGGTGSPRRLTIDRGVERDRVVDVLRAAGQTAGAVVVHGEPDVGKSALALDAVDALRAEGAAVSALSMRDLPRDGLLAVEHQMGATVRRVLAGTAVARIRLLVLDGAEVAQEGAADMLTDFARAAMSAGLGVAAVVRDDARRTVVAALQAAAGAGGDGEPAEPRLLAVPPLTAVQAAQITASYAEVSRLADDARTAWLLQRVGIVDVLLRAQAVAALPDGGLSEADVFNAVWSTWVRQGERVEPGGATPDGREATLLDLARRELTGTATPAAVPDGQALASLRADGLMVSAADGFAWRTRDSFTSDILRDFAVARLLLREDFAPLTAAGALRWALRAARLACQSLLAGSASDPAALETARVQLQRRFDEYADAFGDRWSDVPWEALLTTGFADVGLAAATPMLLDRTAAGLARVMRLVEQRFTRSGAADPVIAGPIVAFILDHPRDSGAWNPSQRDVDKFVARWLRGLIRQYQANLATSGSVPLRVRVRDHLLARDLLDGDELLLESVALLGADLDASARAALREAADSIPAFLARCVENHDAISSLAEADVNLLVHLAEAYYLEQPYPDRWDGGPLLRGDVIRPHRGRSGPPWAAWYYGPFWTILCKDLPAGIALIKRLVAHAARHRVRPEDAAPGQTIADEDLPGITLDVPGIGRRHYVGNGYVWAWYRGTGIGPSPCTSALRALERAADQLLEGGASLHQLIQMVLARAASLAELGLVVGVLVRHIERVNDELDVFLASPDAWQLEHARVGNEGGIRIARDDDNAQQAARRRWTFRNVAGVLVVRAVEAGDQQRVQRLRTVGDALVAAVRNDLRALVPERGPITTDDVPATETAPATGTPTPADAADHIHTQSPPADRAGEDADTGALAPVRLWASYLDADAWHPLDVAGESGWQHQPPDEVTVALGPRQADLDRSGQAWRLLGEYQLRLEPPLHDEVPPVPAAEVLAVDIAIARDLAKSPPAQGPPQSDQVPAAVAAATVRAHAAGVEVDPDDLEWTVRYLIATARHAQRGPFDDENTIYSAGADRSAATAVPLLLLPAFAKQPSVRPDGGDGVLATANDQGLRASRPRPGRRRLARRLLDAIVWRLHIVVGHGVDRSTIDRADGVADAFVTLMTSRSDEVRRFTARALTPVWATPCGQPHAGPSRCRHEIAWAAVEASARDVGIAAWNGRTRPLVPLDGSLTTALATLNPGSLYLPRLAAALIAACPAARSVCCIADQAARLRDALLDAYARTTVHWATHRFEHREASRRTVVAALLDDADDAVTGAEPAGAPAGMVRLLDHARRCAAHPRALADLLGDCAVLATYDHSRRHVLRAVWPSMMGVVLDTFDPATAPREGGYWTDTAVARIIPEPTPSIIDNNMDATIRAAYDGWPEPGELAEPIERWLPWAVGEPDAVDALVGLLRAAAPADQVRLGLPWMIVLVRDRAGAIARRTWRLVAWLAELRDSADLDPSARQQYEHIVDALAAAGDRAAARLQRDDEAS